MKNAHASSIKGLSIAVIILSALGILAAVLLMVFSGVLSAIIMNEGPELMNDMRSEYGGSSMYFNDIDPDDAFFVSAIMMLLGGGLSVWLLICCVGGLIAGILGVMHAANPPKLGLVMGWAIAGTILSFLGGSVIDDLGRILCISSGVILLLAVHAVAQTLERLANGISQLGQILGTKDKQDHNQNDDQLRNANASQKGNPHHILQSLRACIARIASARLSRIAP